MHTAHQCTRPTSPSVCYLWPSFLHSPLLLSGQPQSCAGLSILVRGQRMPPIRSMARQSTAVGSMGSGEGDSPSREQNGRIKSQGSSAPSSGRVSPAKGSTSSHLRHQCLGTLGTSESQLTGRAPMPGNGETCLRQPRRPPLGQLDITHCCGLSSESHPQMDHSL